MEFKNMCTRKIRQGLIDKDFSAKEIVDYSLERINNSEEKIHSFIELSPDLAYKKAAELDDFVAKGEKLPPLAGSIFAFKDNMNLIGTHTTCGSKMLENYDSTFTASCVKHSIEAGAIPIGKNNMDEFAFGSSCETSAFGPTYNPWDLERVPGGSSGGGAAAVASGQVTVALGSDTGGSIRQPGSFCGVVAMKPTYGIVSRYGVVAFGSSLDQVGPFTRNVYDCALTLNALSIQDPQDCTSHPLDVDYTANLDKDLKGKKIGVIPDFVETDGIAPDIKAAYKDAIAKLKDLGCEIIDVSLDHAKDAINAYYILGPCEAFSNLSRFDAVRYGFNLPNSNLDSQTSNSRGTGFGNEVKRRIILGAYLLSSGIYDKYYYRAQQVRSLITQDYTQAFEKVDALVMPTTPNTAFKLGEVSDPNTMYLSDIFTVSLNIAGNCGLHLPTQIGQNSNLPVGIQIVGPAFKDENILQIASNLEKEYKFYENYERITRNF
ncbi:MAG: Asp-tRNA(Asn)/Glu-tRNA(Gln) amidotransferase subunit GatA [Coriobacteriales bacterium]|nr:Asp-tRNA(Asn)/Glu-tRNA(Gln) amidotransferase subunit GatA [Coriobacteriales bacterium]